ncbi:heterokaryon incompatibility protein-domain-containing protein [Epithele typhae]|uniref:heterokaryon incompatibility protein-domain-containing protein n=1 Tax=Epithele typhae TaxID=378194 RepID=UPI0020084070|nr:heterokaryon incompatibility protein-domain-containing protein [Epithele typhae]KAH9941633.1 heterokaryon incompatibility protein-domain-containing protein [Epithele typhae]
MRLLDTNTAGFRDIDDPNDARYAILSHVWDHTDGEQSLQVNPRAISLDLDEACPASLTVLSAKNRECCVFARMNGYRYVWIDTCCIDRLSSAELSEAINSMYEWYSRATVCYAFLADVDDLEDPRSPTSLFRRSKWFTRGWTLQELIAPAEVFFLSRDWRIIGTRETLANVIEEITGIDADILTHRRTLDSVSIARRMSWASKRRTSRVEDEAYSLMGIFGVHMPTIYGEGRNAFFRLQREIIEHCADQSIFAWGHIFPDSTESTSTFQSSSTTTTVHRAPSRFLHVKIRPATSLHS